jgi:hypothetical protein
MGRWHAAVLLSGILVGCGGRVVQEDGSGSPAHAADGGAASSTKSGQGASSSEYDGTVELPECELGYKQSAPPKNAAPCTFLVAGRCYDTKVKACACACPTRTGTTCASGFPDPSVPTLVTCS